MLTRSGAVRTLGPRDQEWALSVCAQDPVQNVFIAARILEGGLADGRASTMGYQRSDTSALVWSCANVVPAQGGRQAVTALAERIQGRRRNASSVFGPTEQVMQMWSHLEPTWGPAREVREEQPVLTMRGLPSESAVRLDPAVQVATPDDLNVIAPAAEAMFTEEIGYPPYRGSGSSYRKGVAALLRRGHTLAHIRDGAVIFKADLGSVALGVAQVQGVWVHPDYRGRGIAAPAMAAVVEHTLRHIAPVVTLYVNNYNAAALATYRRVGFTQTGLFSTILL